MLEARARWENRADNLLVKFMSFQTQDAELKQLIDHGFLRRMHSLEEGVDFLFEQLPPQATSANKRSIRVGTLVLQAFYINIYGCFDNLAHIWVHKNKISKVDGTALKFNDIGFSAKQTKIYGTLSKELQNYLTNLDDWFGHLKKVRHALAHKIPLYIPSKALDDESLKQYKKLEDKGSAALESHDIATWRKCIDRQMSLGRFHPSMVLSHSDTSEPVLFHAQVIRDFATIVEFAEKFLDDFISPDHASPITPPAFPPAVRG